MEGKPLRWWGNSGCRTAGASPDGLGMTSRAGVKVSWPVWPGEIKRSCGTAAQRAAGNWYQYLSGGEKFLSVQPGNFVPLRVGPVSGSDGERSSQEWKFSSSLDKNGIISIPKFGKAAFRGWVYLCSLTALHNKKNVRTYKKRIRYVVSQCELRMKNERAFCCIIITWSRVKEWLCIWNRVRRIINPNLLWSYNRGTNTGGRQES